VSKATVTSREVLRRESTNGEDNAEGKDRRWAKEGRRKDDKKKEKKQDQVKKARKGEDAYIQQLPGAEEPQVRRREEKQEGRRAGSGPGRRTGALEEREAQGCQPGLTLLTAFRALVAAPYAAVHAFVF